MEHVTIRVAWHDEKWNGRICHEPSCNSYCTALDKIRLGKNDEAENTRSGKEWGNLTTLELPPCIAESGGFMNENNWTRTFEHPYADNKKAASTHGKLKPTRISVPPFSTFAVPFATMLKSNQENIDEHSVDALPPDAVAPFPTPWVFGKDRQEALLERFFYRIEANRSLVFFYCKEGQPVDENQSRLVVGLGKVTEISPILRYNTKDDVVGHPMWDRIIGHSISEAGSDGFLLPYHEYLASTGDPSEDERRRILLDEIIVTPESAHRGVFSYACEIASADVALSTLIKCLEAVRAIQRHGIAEGPWAQRENSINAQIASAWTDRGAFPGFGSVLEALGLRLGTSLVLDAIAANSLKPEDDPWPYIDGVLKGTTNPPGKNTSRYHCCASDLGEFTRRTPGCSPVCSPGFPCR